MPDIGSLEPPSFETALRRAREICSQARELSRHAADVVARLQWQNVALEAALERLRRNGFWPAAAPRRAPAPRPGAHRAWRDQPPQSAALRQLGDSLALLEIEAAWMELSLAAEQDRVERRDADSSGAARVQAPAERHGRYPLGA
jgi:hypothetical protein